MSRPFDCKSIHREYAYFQSELLKVQFLAIDFDSDCDVLSPFLIISKDNDIKDFKGRNRAILSTRST